MWRRLTFFSPVVSSPCKALNTALRQEFALLFACVSAVAFVVFFSRFIPFNVLVESRDLVLQESCGPQLAEAFASGDGKVAETDEPPRVRKPFITFILGGPGSGKGTQCAKISKTFRFVHLSAGDLLRSEVSSNSDNGVLIQDIIKEGKIVPSEITVKLIQRAIESSAKDKFLIDGFPRSDENRIAFEKILNIDICSALKRKGVIDICTLFTSMTDTVHYWIASEIQVCNMVVLQVGVEPDLVLYFDCPEEEMVKRVLTRNEGRIDDNIETVKKRLKVFNKLNLPVINYYGGKGKVCKIDAVGTVDDIFERVRPVFATLRVDHG
ncbi:hypothetical protein Taro_020410 [Colocasia esculenta]|uniref:adenylate kinase n=1 Tax=Colocasia esculenta TaxID=4460 RepID=A0A843V8E3_COLES|nr:hypothetical protein [Colocasia esculenta]